jgi:glycosyltransferase involved in cell wall biosynthesis
VLTALLIVDNMRIGGFQRLALDQAYLLGSRGYKVVLCVLDTIPDSGTPSFIHSEKALISDYKVDVIFIGSRLVGQIIGFRRVTRKTPNPRLLLSHSLRATFLLSLLMPKFCRKYMLQTAIHQLPTLSAPKQRTKRFIYAQFTFKLVAYSVAVKADWENYVSRNWLLRNVIARKSISVVRNGIFLPRLPVIEHETNLRIVPRLVYLGRNTSWKGISTFLEVAAHPKLANFELLFMVPYSKDIDLSSISSHLRDRAKVVAGKSIAAYVPRAGDVHLYPANYGGSAKYVESVSLNCLELACLGVPTLLTKHGLGTWPDLIPFHIFYETDWSNIDSVANQVLMVSQRHFTQEEIVEISSIIDINNQINNLLE